MATDTNLDIEQIAFDNLLKRSPWLTAHPDSEGDIPVTDSEHCLIVRVRNYGPEQLKVARLIAAAPELLKLAKGYLRYIEATHGLDMLKEYVEELIARAEGK